MNGSYRTRFNTASCWGHESGGPENSGVCGFSPLPQPSPQGEGVSLRRQLQTVRLRQLFPLHQVDQPATETCRVDETDL